MPRRFIRATEPYSRVAPYNMGAIKKDIFVAEPLQRLLRRTTERLSTVVNVMADRYERLYHDPELGPEWGTLVKLLRVVVRSGDRPLTALEIEALGERVEALAVYPALTDAERTIAATYKQLPYPLKLALVLQAEAAND